ncbi:hypothetical protein OIDMADRAFT_60374 [Oidiodendron maius Zn]|uniref:Uncharacterized protein n=1 Tax=Oidiodendron maius (strain Zn) TaxID=913774 RepID=A0A0C3GEQ1_OIDMZ|nr:hypothetical protein OIDMADRAFT_60374 [Oidiodendron maius Zn]
MTQQIRTEFLNATQRAFGRLEYGVIGGTALAEYGNRRTTSDLDVIVPHDIIDVVEDHLLRHGMVRTAGRGIGYVASDGNCYGLDITSDKALGQIFRTARARHRVMPVDFLLNSKAYSYITRVGPDMQQKKASDAQDIIFLLDYMRRNGLVPDRQQCRWVIDYDFWTAFCGSYQGAEERFQRLGLRRDPTPSSSNRGTRNSSMEIRRASRSSSRH